MLTSKLFIPIVLFLSESFASAQQEKRDSITISAPTDTRASVLRVGIKETPGTHYYRWRVITETAVFRIRTHEPYFYMSAPSNSFKVLVVSSRPVEGLQAQWLPSYTRKSSFVFNPFAPDDDQIAHEPRDKRTPFINPKIINTRSQMTAPSKLAPLNRPHWIRTSIRSFSEEFTVNRSEVYSSPNTKGLGSGFSLEYFLQPTLQLVASLDTHASETTYDEPGLDTPNGFQKRLSTFFGPRIDTLNLETRRPETSLYLGPAFGFHQLPVKSDNQLIYDLGIGLSWSWLPWGLSLDGQIFSSNSRIFNAILTSPWGWQRIFPFAGYYQRDLFAKSDTSQSSFSEKGARLGIGFSW